MGQIYKREETVIHHLKKGRYFFNTPFKMFWNNKEMFVKAIELGFHPSDLPYIRHKYDWYTKWCWDENFVSSLFDMLWNKSNTKELCLSVHWLAEFLPPSITSSDRYLELCRSHRSLFSKYATGTAYESLVMDIERQDTGFNLKKLDSLFEDHSDIIKRNKGLVVDFMSHMLRHPTQILSDREYCLDLVKDQYHWALESLRPLQDDIDFALAVTKSGCIRHMEGFSYRLRSIVNCGDPQAILSKFKFNCQLESELPINDGPAKRKAIKV